MAALTAVQAGCSLESEAGLRSYCGRAGEMWEASVKVSHCTQGLCASSFLSLE